MAFGTFERMVAFRYLRARRQEGFVSVIAAFSLIGIALGVATLIIVMSVMNGFRAELLGRILGLNGHLGVFGTEATLADWDPTATIIAGLPGVVRVQPLVEGQLLVTGKGGRASGAVVRGLRPEDLASGEVGAKLRTGSLDSVGGEEGDDGVVIGHRLALKLGLAVDDDLTFISPQGQATAFGTVPRIKAYRVAAIFDLGMHEYDSNFVFMALPAAQRFFQTGTGVTSLEVFVEDPDEVRAVRRHLVDALGTRVRVFDWQQANSSFFNAIQVERNVMFLILTLIILVAAFNIVSSMIMLVKEKGRDIAVLRTMGATRGMILRIFVLSGASVGILGTLTGFLLGLGFCRNIEAIRQAIQGLTGTELFDPTIYFLSQLPAKVDPVEVVMVVAMGLSLSLLATVYPSLRAASLDPVEALRYE